MNIIAVDDERRALEELVSAIREVVADAEVTGFQTVSPALAYAEAHKIDAAFLDIEMVGMNGLMLAQRLKDINPKVNIIFVTGYQKYTGDAFALHASGYVHKPVSPNAVREQMENLRFTPEPTAPIQELGPYTFDHTTQRVYYKGSDALLTQKEYQLLCIFAENPGVSFMPEDLFLNIWGSDAYSGIDTVKVHVSNLRRKLEMGAGKNPNLIKRRAEGFYLKIEP